jgi:uncharacterized protein (TIGR00290 family)
MKLAALITGGKDSLYSLYLASKEYEITKLIALRTDPYIHVIRKQAAMMGSHLTETDDLEKTLSLLNIDGLVTGATASTQGKMDIDSICKRLDLLYISPLWHFHPKEYVRSMLDDGFELVIASVNAHPFDRNWLGRPLNEETLNELIELEKKYGISAAGEGGEYETIVLNSPLFIRGLEIDAEPHWDEKEKKGHLEIQNVRLRQHLV